MKRRGAAAETFARLTFVFVGSLVLWGVLLLASAVTDSFSEGAVAFVRLVPSSTTNGWGWLGAFSVVLALVAGLLGAAFLATKRATRGSSSGG